MLTFVKHHLRDHQNLISLMEDKKLNLEETTLKPWIKPTVEIISKDRIQVGSVATTPEGNATPGTIFTGSGS